MGIVRRYRLFALTALVLAVLFGFLSFFFVFLLAPVVPLGLFYFGYLFHRERQTRGERRSARLLLARESDARRRRMREETS